MDCAVCKFPTSDCICEEIPEEAPEEFLLELDKRMQLIDHLASGGKIVLSFPED